MDNLMHGEYGLSWKQTHTKGKEVDAIVNTF